MTVTRQNRLRLVTGLGFLAPNILGFLVFTLVPLIFSLVLAFSNWDLKQHNLFHPDVHIHFVGFDNFRRLITGSDFWKFLGNTLFFMMALPFGIAASLIAALLLSKDLSGGRGRARVALVAAAILLTSTSLLIAAGAAAAGMVLLFIGVVGGILILGTAAGTAAYRTLLYVPSFTSGVATFLLWKKFYNPQSGPINLALAGPLEALGNAVNHAPSGLIGSGGFWFCSVLAVLVLVGGIYKITRWFAEAEISFLAALLSAILMLVPAFFNADHFGLGNRSIPCVVAIVLLGALMLMWVGAWKKRGGSVSRGPWEGLGSAFMFAAVLMIGEFTLLGLAEVLRDLPAMARVGLQPPSWLSQYEWAKPAIMLMGFWAAIGSNTMLLYLAALMNVPGELYEAADIDGASRFTRFWNVTWPQLAPTTFFVVVMGMIGGLQSGFETAKVMTNGGPAGSTTTLSYFIYTEGFETGRLGFSSAVAWTIFALVLLLTLFNWTLGSRYVND